MKTSLLFLTLFLVFFSFGAKAQITDEEAIKTVALNYFEGWYAADTSRVAKALSKDLVKRGFMFSHRANKLVKNESGYAEMIDVTSKKPNQQSENFKIEVNIIEIGKNIAMVKITSPHFKDYVHMGKMEGEWKIYNVIWEPNF